MGENKPEKTTSWRKWAIWAVVFVVVAWAGVAYVTTLAIDSPEQRGQFGDMFGAINALFTGLAFAGVIITLIVQQKELKAQQKAIEKQQFETSFFQLLRLHNENLKSIDLMSPRINIRQIQEELQRYNNLQGFWAPEPTKGRDSLEQLYSIFFLLYHVFKNEKDEAKRIESAWNIMYEDYQTDLSAYFRMLYNIVKFVDRSEIDDKKRYTNIIRAQLSNFETALVFYDCLTPMGRDKFKPLVLKYDFLRHAQSDILINPSHLALIRV